MTSDASFRVLPNRRAVAKPVNAIFARHMAPVLRQSKDGERAIVLMSWKFLRLETARAPNPVTNVRSDQIKAKPFWRDSLPKRRCLVPASSLCQPNGAVQPAPWRRFETKRPLYLSGVWRRCRVIHQAM
jgi:putative SOS response-associated peptidase YedK